MLTVGAAQLAFPAGVAPGFDPTHIAGAGVRFSGIALAGNFINLLNGARGAITGSPTGAIDGVIGPATNYPTAGSTAQSTFSGNAATNDTSSTIAAIVRFPATGATFQGIFANGSNAAGINLGLKTPGALVQLTMFGVVARDSAIVISPNIPYFIAASQNGSTIINYVAARLDNGVVVTSTSASGTPTAPNGTFVIGNGPAGSTPASGNIAAVMYSNKYTSMQQLLAWAADPWSFWYPRGA